MNSFWGWVQQIGWRWLFAIVFLILAWFVLFNLTDQASSLQGPLVAGLGGGFSFLTMIPDRRPTLSPFDHIGWFKLVVAIVATSILWSFTFMSLPDKAKEIGITPEAMWGILSALGVLAFLAAAGAVYTAWFLIEAIGLCMRSNSSSNQVNSPATAAQRWAEAERLANQALEVAREAGRLEASQNQNPHP